MRVTEARDDRDDAAFSALLERHRRELQVHCCRMLGSFENAEDLVQAVVPPLSTWWEGRDAIVAAMAQGPFQPEFGRLRLVPIRANASRRPPATCAGRVTRSSARSASMCCGSRTVGWWR